MYWTCANKAYYKIGKVTKCRFNDKNADSLLRAIELCVVDEEI